MIAGEAAAAPFLSRLEQAWRSHLLALIAALVAILLIFQRDLAHMATIWWESSTFNHCLLIPPIIAWLVWQRREALARLVPQAWAPGLGLVFAGALGWLMGEAAGLSLARHAGLVVMLQGAVVACLGKAVARGLAFPLFYALFLIPFGEEIVPFMQMVTAQMCMVLLDLVGIPAHIEGIFISIPSGLFEVAEACAGVKFLVAMLAYGALVANVCFRSWTRRLLFMGAAILIPILANGIRAWGTIYIAHHSSIDFAAGFDHIFYGWIFFAVVIALLMAAGWRFFDRGIDDPWFDPAHVQPQVPAVQSRGRLFLVGAAAVALALLAQGRSDAMAASGEERAPSDIRLPELRGWSRVPGDLGWNPRFEGADRIRIGRYRNAAGQEVDLAIAFFSHQQEGRELVGFGQGEADNWAWVDAAEAPPGGRAARIVSNGRLREVVTFYRVGNVTTGSVMVVKLETMKTRLLGGPQRAVALLVSAPADAEGDGARAAIDAFLADLGPVPLAVDQSVGH